jgi:hypothetical protein
MILKTALAVGALAVAAALVVAAARPDTFHVARSTRIQAPAARIHPLINDMARFNTWNPYARKDPEMQGRLRGPAAGPGAAFDFHGRESGSGSLEIVDSAPARVTMKLDMREPMAGHNTVVFTLVPQGDATEVTWAMHGASPYVARLIGLVFDMDTLIGRDFEAGLSSLKAAAERG